MIANNKQNPKIISEKEELSKVTYSIDNIYEIIKTLGKGATSTVYLAKYKENNHLYAIKKLTKKGHNIEIYRENFQNEIKNLQRLKHENIISLVFYKFDGTLICSNGKEDKIAYIVLEYAENGELYNYIHHSKKGFGEKIGKKIFLNFINSVSFCHYNGIIHRDLKIENIVLDSNWNLKIADFGFASEISGGDGTGMMHDFRGTISYAAPEVLIQKPYIGSFADIFSCGIILFLLIAGDFPFRFACSKDNIYNYIIDNDYEQFWDFINKRFKENFSDGFKNLINLMLSYDPTQRPSLSEIKANSWLAEDNSDEIQIKEEFEKRKIQANKIKVLNYVLHLNNANNKDNSNLFKANDQNEDKEFYDKKIPEYFFSKFDDFKNMKYIPSNNPHVYKFIEADLKQIMRFFFKIFEDDNLYIMKMSKKKLKFRLKMTQTPDNELEDNLIVDFYISKLNKKDSIVELIKMSNCGIQFKDLLLNLDKFNQNNFEKMHLNVD